MRVLKVIINCHEFESMCADIKLKIKWNYIYYTFIILIKYDIVGKLINLNCFNRNINI